MSELLKKKDLIQLLKINDGTFRNWKKAGMPIVKMQNAEFFDIEQVKRWHKKVTEEIDNLIIDKNMTIIRSVMYSNVHNREICDVLI